MRDLLLKVLLLGLSLAFCLGVAEGTLRLLAPHENQNSGRLYRLEPNYEMRRSNLLPHADATLVGVRVRTNSHGMRDREHPIEKEPGSYRIAVFGDSFTFGYGVEQEDVFPEVLERRLGEELERRVEVLNFGIPGMNSFLELLYHANFARRFAPDLVLMVWVPFDHATEGYSWENFEQFVSGLPVQYATEPAPDPAAAGSYMQRLFVYRFFGRRLKNAIQGLGFYIDRHEETEFRDASSEGHRISRASIVEMRRRVLADGADFRFVIFPFLHGLDSEPYRDLLYSGIEEHCRQNEIEYINLLPGFEGESPSRLHISIVDAHPNARAHRIAAAGLFKALAPMLR